VSGKTIVIPQGVVPSLRISRAPRHSLLYAGRVIPAKGVDRLIRAVALLKRRKIDVTLHIAGKGNPLYERKIKLLARRLGIDSRIRWLGFIQPHRMTLVYPHFGAVVMPSRQESFGMVALEAMAHGVPLVTTRAGGLKEIVNAGNANIIPSVTPPAIASAIASMLKHPKLTHQRVRNARATASRYTWHRAAAHYKAVYQQLI
jgi:glycosyltransferase involved in cell wall biosynthesis